jgi:dTDP-D-glucose 4,6-dehydratase
MPKTCITWSPNIPGNAKGEGKTDHMADWEKTYLLQSSSIDCMNNYGQIIMLKELNR